MSSNDKIKIKAIETSCILLGFCFCVAALLLTFGYHFFEYRFNEILIYYLSTYFCSAIILLYMEFVSVKQIKFYYIFVFIIFLLFLVTIFQYLINGNLKNIFGIIFDTSVWTSATILIINNLITRVFFREGDNKNSQDVDAVSSEFAVDVISVTLFFGIIFGTIAYLSFVPNNNLSLFLGGIDIKTVAIATAGLITFFWAAKTAKNRSIELNMLQRRDTAQLIAKASELLGSENDAQKYAGLAFLNTVASQKGGPLQKEAFDLLADFILSATDTTTANNPRMRAIIYVDDLLEESCRHFAIYEFIVISASDGAGPYDAINDLNSLRIKNLYITYIGLAFGARAIHWATHSKNDYQFSFVSCKLDGRRIREPPEIIKNILVTNCYINNFQIFYICNIFKNALVQVHNSVTKESKFVNAIPKKYLPKNQKSINRFLECDFSSSKNWKDTRSNIEAGQEKDVFDRCFYYAGHPPYGFDKKLDGALLTEISSERQFDELIDDTIFMMYLPPDDKKTPNE